MGRTASLPGQISLPYAPIKILGLRGMDEAFVAEWMRRRRRREMRDEVSRRRA